MPQQMLAAILVLTDSPDPDKQRARAAKYAEQHDLRVVSICYHWPDCFAMLVNRHVTVVVAAVDPGLEPRQAIEQAGGVLHVVPDRRVDDRVRHRVSIGRIAVRLHNRGYDTTEISKILGVDTGEIRRLRRRRHE